MATQNAQWISLDWSNSSELLSTRTSESLFKVSAALSSVKKILTDLTLEKPALPADKRWIFPESDHLTAVEYKVSKAFLVNLANARGRQMMYCIMELLYADRTDIAVTNIGGGGTVDPNVKVAQLEFTITPANLSTSDSSPDNSPPKYLELTEKGNRKRPLDTPSYAKACKSLRLSDEEVSLPTVNKNCVPDLLIKKFNEHGEIIKEMLNVSVKKGFILTEKDHHQIKFELLPVLTRQPRALGLLICAGDAYLYLLTLVRNEVQISRKH